MTVYGVAAAFAFYFGPGIAAVFCGAYSFFQNQRIQLGPLKTFLFIRPVSTKDLASARIAGTLQSVLISIPPIVVTCAIAVFIAARSNNPDGLPGFVHEHMGLGGVAIAILLLLAFLAALWSIQWFGNILAFGAIFYVGVMAFYMVAEFESFRSYMYMYLREIFRAAILVAYLVCAFLFYLAHRRGLLETKNLYIALAAMPFLAAGWFTFLNLGNLQHGQPYDFAQLAEVMPFAILPIAPIATVPLIMHFARHR